MTKIIMFYNKNNLQFLSAYQNLIYFKILRLRSRMGLLKR